MSSETRRSRRWIIAELVHEALDSPQVTTIEVCSLEVVKVPGETLHTNPGRRSHCVALALLAALIADPGASSDCPTSSVAPVLRARRQVGRIAPGGCIGPSRAPV